jgi:hypothetical protein
MSKQYKGKTCVYCAQPESSQDGDHVLSRQFFLPTNRKNLPKVPACKACNNKKSELEHYLTAVMPFGGRHEDSAQSLSSMVPPRLQGNRKLRETLSMVRSAILTSHNGGPWVRRLSLPFDGERLLDLSSWITRGLAFHHWGLIFESNCIVRSTLLNRHGQRFIDPLFSKIAAQRVQINLGNGVFRYEGVQATDVPLITMWRMSLYGAEMSNSAGTDVSASTIYSFTAPKTSPNAIEFIESVVG